MSRPSRQFSSVQVEAMRLARGSMEPGLVLMGDDGTLTTTNCPQVAGIQVSGDAQLADLVAQDAYITRLRADGITTQALEATISHHQVLRADRAILDRTLITTKLVLPPTVLQPAGATCYMAPQIVAGSTDPVLLLDDYALNVQGDGQVTGTLKVWNLDVINTISPPPNIEFKYVWAREFATRTLAVGTLDLISTDSPYVLDVSGISRFQDSIEAISASFTGGISAGGVVSAPYGQFTTVTAGGQVTVGDLSAGSLVVGGHSTLGDLSAAAITVAGVLGVQGSLMGATATFTDVSMGILSTGVASISDLSAGTATVVGGATIIGGVYIDTLTVDVLNTGSASHSDISANSATIGDLSSSRIVVTTLVADVLDLGSVAIDGLTGQRMTVEGAAVLAGGVSIQGGLDVSGGATLDILNAGVATLGSLVVSGDATVQGGIIGDSLDVSGRITAASLQVGTIGGPVLFTGVLTAAAGVDLSGGTAQFDTLTATGATLTTVLASGATITSLDVSAGSILSLTATQIQVAGATITNLDVSAGSILSLTATQIQGAGATITSLDVSAGSIKTLSVDQGGFTGITAVGATITTLDVSAGSIKTLTAIQIQGAGATITNLDVSAGSIKTLTATQIQAAGATITNLDVSSGSMKSLVVGQGGFTGITATGATIMTLDVSAGSIKTLTATQIQAAGAMITNLDVSSGSMKSLSVIQAGFTGVTAIGATITSLSATQIQTAGATITTLDVSAGSIKSLSVGQGGFTGLQADTASITDLSAGTIRAGQMTLSGAVVMQSGLTVQGSLVTSDISSSTATITTLSGQQAILQTIDCSSCTVDTLTANTASIQDISAAYIDVSSLVVKDISGGSASLSSLNVAGVISGVNAEFTELLVQHLVYGDRTAEFEADKLVVGGKLDDIFWLGSKVLDISGDSLFRGNVDISGGLTALSASINGLITSGSIATGAISGGSLTVSSVTTNGGPVNAGTGAISGGSLTVSSVTTNGGPVNAGTGSVSAGSLTLKNGTKSVTLQSNNYSDNILDIQAVSIYCKDITSNGIISAVNTMIDTINTYSNKPLTINGSVKMVPLGSAMTPSMYWNTDTDTGMYHPSDGIIRMSSNGSDRLEINTSGVSVLGSMTTSDRIQLNIDGTASRPAIVWPQGGLDVDSGFYHAGDGDIRTSINGVDRLTVNGAGVAVTGNLSCTGTITGSFTIRFPVVTL